MDSQRLNCWKIVLKEHRLALRGTQTLTYANYRIFLHRIFLKPPASVIKQTLLAAMAIEKRLLKRSVS